jgi:hypothetical protein
MNKTSVSSRHLYAAVLSRGAVLAVAACTLFACFGTASAETEDDGKKWTPFETIDQSALPIVRVGLNGSGPHHRLVLDVGFNDFILDTTLVAGLGLELVSRNEVATIDFYGREERVPVGYLEELALGGAQFRMVRTLLVEGEDGTGSGGLRSYGRIGRDVLEPLRMTVHYPRRLLYMEPSPADEVPDGGVEYRSEGRSLVIPVSFFSENRSVDASLVLDASSPMNLLDHKWAVREGLAEKNQSQARVPELSVGSFRTEQVPFFLGEMKDLPYEGKPVGVIGADLVRALSVTYDFSRDLLWFVAVEESSPNTMSEGGPLREPASSTRH